jgi:hypothetical protein
MEERKSDGASKSNLGIGPHERKTSTNGVLATYPVSRDCLLRDKEQSPFDSGGKKNLESRLDGSLKIVCENRVDTPALCIHILMSQKEIGGFRVTRIFRGSSDIVSSLWRR